MNTARNEAILELAAMGWHRSDIAGALGLSVGTVNGVMRHWGWAPRRLSRWIMERIAA